MGETLLRGFSPSHRHCRSQHLHRIRTRGEGPKFNGEGQLPLFTLQIILELCIPEKELAKTRSQISFIYFQSHS